MTVVTAVSPGAGTRVPTPLGWRHAIATAFVVTLVRPSSWVFGLAGFLAGGGLVVVAWPILVLPTPTGLQNALGGPVSTIVFGGASATLVILVLAGVAGVIAAILAGTWVGSWAERQMIVAALEVAADEGLIGRPRADLDGSPGAGRVAIVRLLSLVPVALVLLLSWAPIYDAAYRQLILPDEMVTPLPVRVIRDVPWLVVAVTATWLLSDAAAALGVRRLVVERRGVLAAWLLGWADLVRRPHRVLATQAAGVGVTVLLLGPALLASATGWARVREVVVTGQDAVAVVGTVGIWVATWLGGLILAGVAAAFRAAAWTFETTTGR